MVSRPQKKAVPFKIVPKIESGMKEVEKEMENAVEQVGEFVSQTLYFGLGAGVLIRESLDEFVDKAVKRGQSSEKNMVKKVRSMFKMGPRAKKMESTLEQRIETAVRSVLDSLDIPSKSDVEKLTKRVAELSGRVSRLTRSKKVMA